jgi:hypothetical protein
MAIAERPLYPPLIHRRAWLLALFLGLSLAAAATARIECGPVLLATGNGAVLATGSGSLLATGGRCELQLGDLRVTLPSWLDAILKVISCPTA